MTLDIKVDSVRLQRALQAAPGELYESLRGVANQIGKRYIGFFRAKRLRGPPGVRGTRGQPGRPGLLNAFRYDIGGTNLNRLRVDIGTRSRVALEHEEGRLIRAKEGRFLLVPLQIRGKEMTRAQIKNARAKRRSGALFFFRARNGQRFLAERTSKKGRPRLVFALVPAVKLSPRLKFRLTWLEFRPNAIKLFNQGLKFALAAARKKAGGGVIRRAA